MIDITQEPQEPTDECCGKKPIELTLEEAIAHAEECVNDTPCGQNHRQLVDWLKELKEYREGNFGKCKPLRDVLLAIHDELENYVSHKIVVESMCLRIKNIINNALKPNIWGMEKIPDSLLPDEYVSTMPALAKAASVCPYGGVTGRPRKLKGYLKLPDGREFWLGEIRVKFDGWGDGLITDVDLDVLAERFERTGTEEEDVTEQVGNNAEMRKALNDLIEDATLDYEIKDAPVAGAPGERTEYHVVDAETIIDECRAALAKPPRNCDVGKTAETLLEEFITNRGYSSPNQIGMLYQQALPIIKWVLS